MAKTTRIQVRIDPETKSRADELFDSVGLNTSTAVNLFIQQALRVGGLPFNIESETTENLRAKKVRS